MKTTFLAFVAILCLSFLASAADISGKKWTIDVSAVSTGKVAGDELELTFDMGGRGSPRTVTLKKGE